MESAVLATVNTPVLRPDIEQMAKNGFSQYVEGLYEKGISFAKVSSQQSSKSVVAIYIKSSHLLVIYE